MRFFVDTNVWISALAFDGPESRFVLEAKSQQVSLVVSEDVLGEFFEVVRRKFPVLEPESRCFFIGLSVTILPRSAYSALVERQVVRDLSDKHVLAAALYGRCDAIVTGDKDLLVLGRCGSMDVLNAGAALRRMRGC